MRMRAPRMGAFPEITIAEEQEEYAPLTAAPVTFVTFSDGSKAVVSRWTFTDEERARIAAGDDLYVTLLTFGRRMQPISLTVGVPDFVEAP